MAVCTVCTCLDLFFVFYIVPNIPVSFFFFSLSFGLDLLDPFYLLSSRMFLASTSSLSIHTYIRLTIDTNPP